MHRMNGKILSDIGILTLMIAEIIVAVIAMCLTVTKNVQFFSYNKDKCRNG